MGKRALVVKGSVCGYLPFLEGAVVRLVAFGEVAMVLVHPSEGRTLC
jgi:hypothetical protein